ncbi:oligosaccharide flippase family protein [Shimia sp. MMG029]|uniref:oligosaccharide flippase family protein n=1 Tax=Shimia sp. MMG029 TaxID=3021978 RepID=UPI0022FE4C15|nr:oligosaccharide flippase family protein [Shimia sp. MMG029]MDA5558130.1 oligosaccharide flippase family protein [Shimia sp. MMG029]
MTKNSPSGTADASPNSMKRIGLALFALIARSLQQVATFVITLLAARFLAPAEYGVYALAIVFITLIQTMTYSGFYQWIVNAKEDDKLVLGTAFWMITGLATLAASLLALFAWPLAWIFDAPDLFPVLVLLAAIQPVAGAGAWFSAVLLRRGAVNTHFSIMFAQNLVALVGGAILLWTWQSLFALVAFRYLRVLTAILLYLLFSPDRPSFVFRRDLARQATKFSGGLYGARFLNFLSRYSGDLMLGLMFTTAEAGLYRFGNRLASGATDIVAQPLRSFALTQFGAAARKDAELSTPLKKFTGSIVLLTGIVAAVVVVMAPTVVEFFFDPAYLAALTVTAAIAVRSVLNVGSLILEPALAARDRTGLVALFNLVWTILTIASVLIASPFGLAALAWSQAAIMMLNSLSALLVLHRAGIETRPAFQSFTTALAIVGLYYLSLTALWSNLQDLFTAELTALSVGLMLAAALGGVVLYISSKLRVFTLSVFSG